MKRINLLFSFAFLFFLTQGINAQTVSISAGAQSSVPNAGFNGSCTSVSSWGIGDQGVGAAPGPNTYTLNFSSPVTEVSIPIAGFDGNDGPITIDAVGVSEVISDNCGDVSTSGNSLTTAGLFTQVFDVTVSSGTPFTQIVITNGGIFIPTASFLNSYGGFIVSAPSADSDGDGVDDVNDSCPGSGTLGNVDSQGCPDTDGDATFGSADPDGSDPCNPNPNDAACGGNCNAGSTAPQFGN